ncbi:MAG: Gfo/Idh/MocA family oxidoreductase [Candidatus Lokiarchaeota archaeon]|nr:Gfo/Idh/MocA family oxidoreductase [Candidatus Harpocratesius repetitus]
MKLKIGIIGAGFIAERHIHAFCQIPEVEIAGICSRNTEKALILARKYNIQPEIFSDYQILLNQEYDAVSICLPNYLHKDVAIQALSKGMHVFIEKPLARTVAEGVEMIHAARKSQRMIMYCENNMFAPAFVKAKELIDSGSIGDIFMGRGREHHSGPHSAWFYKKHDAGGGSLIDLGIHDIACIVWLTGMDVKEVFCQIQTNQPDRHDFGRCEVEDNAIGILYMENGAQISIEESWTVPSSFDVKIELYGENGQIIVNPSRMAPMEVFCTQGYGYAVEKASTTKGWTFPIPDENSTFGYLQEMNYFVRCIQQQNSEMKVFPDGIFGLKILAIVEAMYVSAQSRKIEKVEYPLIN